MLDPSAAGAEPVPSNACGHYSSNSPPSPHRRYRMLTYFIDRWLEFYTRMPRYS